MIKKYEKEQRREKIINPPPVSNGIYKMHTKSSMLRETQTRIGRLIDEAGRVNDELDTEGSTESARVRN